MSIYVMVGRDPRENLKLGLVLFGTGQQDVYTHLMEMMLHCEI